MQAIPLIHVCLLFLLSHTRATKNIYLKFYLLLLTSHISHGWCQVGGSRHVRCRKHLALTRKRPASLPDLKSHWLLMTWDHQEWKSMVLTTSRVITHYIPPKMFSSSFSRPSASWDCEDKNHISFINILSAHIDPLQFWPNFNGCCLQMIYHWNSDMLYWKIYDNFQVGWKFWSPPPSVCGNIGSRAYTGIER